MDGSLIKRSFKEAFTTFKKNWKLLIAVTLCAGFIILTVIVLSILAAYLLPHDFSPKYLHVAEGVTVILLYQLIPFFGSYVLFFAFSGFMVLCSGKKVSAKDFFPGFKPLLRYFIFIFFVIICYTVATFSIPVLLMFLRIMNTADAMSHTIAYLSGFPMFVAAVISFFALTAFFVRFSFTFFALLEGLSLKESVKKSLRITSRDRTGIFFIFVLLFFVNVAGFATVFGMLAVMPYSMLVLTHLYYMLAKLPAKSL